MTIKQNTISSSLNINNLNLNTTRLSSNDSDLWKTFFSILTSLANFPQDVVEYHLPPADSDSGVETRNET